MNIDKLQALAKALKATDEQEQQTRKSVMSRRWFVRTLLGTVASAAILGMGSSAKAIDCDEMNACSSMNVCGPAPNTCSGNTCSPNVCISSNLCNPKNYCATWNSCYVSDACLGDDGCHLTNNCFGKHTGVN